MLIWMIGIIAVLFILNGLLFRRRKSSFNGLTEGKEQIGYRQNSHTRSNWPG